MLENYKTPEPRKRRYLDDAIALIIVHANPTHDPNKISKKPIQDLIDKNFADYIYEFMAFHTSFVKHNGTIIDNNRCPGDYHIDSLAGNDYILVGGGLGNCHFNAYFALLASRLTRKTTIHLPAEAIYITNEEYEGGNTYLSSELVSLTNEEFGRYKALVKIRGNAGYEIICDNKAVESSGNKSLRLMLWSSKDVMLQYLSTNKQDVGK